MLEKRGQPVRHGKGYCLRRRAADAEGWLEADIALLERLRAAHEDDQYAVRRQMRDAEREIEISTRRIGEIGQDIARLKPTSGDAFTMAVLGREYTERKEAAAR